MRLRDEEFPVVVQAYDPSGSKDSFVAEQVVYSQMEIDNFTSRYAGLLIKAREVSDTETTSDPRIGHRRTVTKHRSGSAVGWVLFLLVVIIGLLVWGFASGWIQQNFGINPPV